MFKKLAAEVFGLSEIGIVVPKADFDKTESDDFVMHESGEEIFFLIKTKADEYCFTNKALIHVDGANAISKKRTLKRYEYAYNLITDVELETAGTIDLDVEIKFTIGNIPLSVDIHKRFLTEIKDLYKVLFAISLEVKDNEKKYTIAENSLSYASQSMGRLGNDEVTPAQSFEDITRFANNWMLESRLKYAKKDFKDVFELYINQ
ncbi:PH domain-containing protein [Paenisporosarcina sp. TG-14]|uniref:PH domain-containing protein n=1 Tax=Paenisporosarcina sp. TG-14 TaxID=1231057 RepID=UPI0002D91CB1|nr:PH domain-containing protein [Paenisporosarcina sp. TG-14]